MLGKKKRGTFWTKFPNLENIDITNRSSLMVVLCLSLVLLTHLLLSNTVITYFTDFY